MVNPDEQPNTNGPMADHEPALIEAVIVEAVEAGRADIAPERISARAEISSSAFSACFPSVQAAVEAAHETLFEDFLGRLVRVCDAQPNWPLRVKVGVAAALDLAAASPVRARFLMLDSLAVDRALVLKAIESRERIARLLAAGRSDTRHGPILPAVTEQMLIAGISGVILARLVSGEAKHLPALAPQLVEFTLIPYLGREEAAEVARRPRPRFEGG